ncbi:DoxX family protein [Streptosporangium sp. NPDC087985]|uniref:DoxX family protein n=1 Tax=Streptosporangium sp. NPDC087985 TaxID=3366196 RepID=UPI00380F3BD6
MRRFLYDLAALIVRLVLGVVFIAHGWQKLGAGGINGTAATFTSMGVPLPRLAAVFAIVIELGGGILLILGLLTPLVALLIVANMLGAFFSVHAGKGVFVSEGGFELVAALGSAALLLAAGGAGRISLDRLIFGRRGRRHRDHENASAYVPPIKDESPPSTPPTTAQPQQPTPPEDAGPGSRPEPPDVGYPPC